MQLKPDPTTAKISSAVPVATLCANCGAEERRLLHHVRHRGIFRRLCTTCVLRLHPQSFCPTCFQVYPPSPSNDSVFTCFKCYSSSHSHCVSGGPTPPPSPYICPLCVHPSTPIFKLKTAKEVNVEIGEDCKVMDGDAAKKLLAAARIASASMNKAAMAAKAEAERRAKEAAYTRKRAKEALEHVAYLMMNEKLRKKEAVPMTTGEVSGSGVRGVGNNVGYAGGGNVDVKVEGESNVNVSSSINRNGSVGGGSGSSVAIEEKVNNVGNMDNSNQVLAALNAVELRENVKIGEITAVDDGLETPLDDFCAVMDVDEKERVNVVEITNENGDDHVIFADSQSDGKNINMEVESGEDVSNGVALVQPVEDHVTYNENSNNAEQLVNGSPQ